MFSCNLCDKSGYYGLNLLNGKHICFKCIEEIKKFQYYAPMPNQEKQPNNYFPQIGVA